MVNGRGIWSTDSVTDSRTEADVIWLSEITCLQT